MTKTLASIFLNLMKFFGLIQFNISMSDFKISISKPLLAYSFLMTVFNIICTILATKNAIQDSVLDKFILMLFFRLRLTVGFVRIVLIYIFQFFNYKSYINFLKEAFFIHSHLNKMFPPEHFVDKFVWKCFMTKIGMWIFQIFLMLSNLFVYIQILVDRRISDYGSSLLSVCYMISSNIIKTSISCIYFGSMIIIMQFYNVVNKNISKMMHNVLQMDKLQGKNKIKMQVFCNFSDELDRISKIFDHVTSFLNKQLQFFTMQLLLLIIDSFCCILYEVSEITSDWRVILSVFLGSAVNYNMLQQAT